MKEQQKDKDAERPSRRKKSKHGRIVELLKSIGWVHEKRKGVLINEEYDFFRIGPVGCTITLSYFPEDKIWQYFDGLSMMFFDENNVLLFAKFLKWLKDDGK